MNLKCLFIEKIIKKKEVFITIHAQNPSFNEYQNESEKMTFSETSDVSQ